MTKWYWWVLLGVAVILTTLVVVASLRTKSKKVEDKIADSDPDIKATTSSETYKTLGRVAEMSINPVAAPVATVGAQVVATPVSAGVR